MTENINASIKKAAECAASVLAALAGIWWGIRMGGGLYYRTGADLRLPLILLMLTGLLMQGYSSVKTDRKYNSLYRIGIWISGILISLLIYGLFFLLFGDIAVLIVRHFLHIQTASGHGTFRMVVFGAAPEVFPAAYGDVWGSPVWNFETPPLLGLILSGAVTLFGISHARRLRVTSYKISFPDFHRKEYGNTSKRSTEISKAENPMRSPEPSKQHAEMSGTDPLKFLSHPESPGRSSANKSFRIVQLSDLHMGSVVGSRYIRKILRETARLKPDCVVITGDLFNHGFAEECAHIDRIEEAFKALNDAFETGWQGESHVFAVCGNHDPQPGDPAFKDFLEKSGITLLDNETVTLPGFVLAGRGGCHLCGRPDLASWLTVPENGSPVILLDHYPDSIPEARKYGVFLTLCGHTHGGQYFPCTYLVRARYRKSEGLLCGFTDRGDTKSIVSSGTGFFQIPIRIGTDSEIVCIDLIS